MKIEKEFRDDHQVKLTVEVESERLEEMKRRAAAKISRKVKLPGFRPGKAPYAVIVRQVGEASIIEEAIESLVEEIYPQVIKEAEIKAFGPGQLENVASMEPLILEFLIPLEAEVVLGDYHSIQKPYEPGEVTEEEIQDVIRDIRDRQAVIEPVERPVQAGDLVSVLISSSRLNPEEGQDPVVMRERSYPIIIPAEGETPADEWPFPGFSDHLIGLARGDEKDLEFTYPEDSAMESLRGISVVFHLKVENVKARTLPDVDDELARSLGEFETLEEMQEQIRESLEKERIQGYNQDYDDEIINQAVEMSVFKYPPQMLEQEIDEVIHNLEHRLEHQNMTLDLYLKSRSLEMDAFREEIKPIAEKRLKHSLFLVEFGKTEEIKIEPEELEKEAVGALNYLQQTMDEKEARKLSDRMVQSNIINSVFAELITSKSIRHFRKLAGGVVEDETEIETPEGETGNVDEVTDDESQSVESNKESLEDSYTPESADASAN